MQMQRVRAIAIAAVALGGMAAMAAARFGKPIEKAGWVNLFDGKTLDGWTNYKKKDVKPGWQVKDGALACVDEQLAIGRARHDGQTYLLATANRGEVLGAMGRVDEGLAALAEARSIAANAGMTPMVQQLDQMIAGLRAGRS